MAIEIITAKIDGQHIRITMSYRGRQGEEETNPPTRDAESGPELWIPDARSPRPPWLPGQLYDKLHHFPLAENLEVGIIGAQGTEPDGLQAGQQGDQNL